MLGASYLDALATEESRESRVWDRNFAGLHVETRKAEKRKFQGQILARSSALCMLHRGASQGVPVMHVAQMGPSLAIHGDLQEGDSFHAYGTKKAEDRGPS